jgi:hypothetical protein
VFLKLLNALQQFGMINLLNGSVQLQEVVKGFMLLHELNKGTGGHEFLLSPCCCCGRCLEALR